MVHYKEYKNHHRRCENRNVNCPGTECNKLLSLREVVAHTKICPAISTLTGQQFYLAVHDDYLRRKEFFWRTFVFIRNSKHFFLKTGKYDNQFSQEAVMLGSPEEWEDYRAEISILDSKHHSVLSSSFSPGPICLERRGNKCLTATQEVLASIWKYDEE